MYNYVYPSIYIYIYIIMFSTCRYILYMSVCVCVAWSLSFGCIFGVVFARAAVGSCQVEICGQVHLHNFNAADGLPNVESMLVFVGGQGVEKRNASGITPPPPNSPPPPPPMSLVPSYWRP
jgi:hypothetical protein